MPEGHSIHRLARQFNDVFAHQVLSVSSPQGRFVDGAARLDGARMEEAFAHGKHLFLRFDHDLFLNVHLGIYGAWSFGGDQDFTGGGPPLAHPERWGSRRPLVLVNLGNIWDHRLLNLLFVFVWSLLTVGLI